MKLNEISKKAERNIYVTAIRSGTVYLYNETGFAQYLKRKWRT